jgi:hypothetical protein
MSDIFYVIIDQYNMFYCEISPIEGGFYNRSESFTEARRFYTHTDALDIVKMHNKQPLKIAKIEIF